MMICGKCFSNYLFNRSIISPNKSVSYLLLSVLWNTVTYILILYCYCLFINLYYILSTYPLFFVGLKY